MRPQPNMSLCCCFLLMFWLLLFQKRRQKESIVIFITSIFSAALLTACGWGGRSLLEEADHDTLTTIINEKSASIKQQLSQWLGKAHYFMELKLCSSWNTQEGKPQSCSTEEKVEQFVYNTDHEQNALENPQPYRLFPENVSFMWVQV